MTLPFSDAGSSPDAGSSLDAASSPGGSELHSALYIGRLRHRRFDPLEHAFRYRLFMVYLDLGELDRVFAGRWLWSTDGPALARFRSEDYLREPPAGRSGPPAADLDTRVRDLVEAESGRRPRGPVTLLTHLRYLGVGFNPVSFFYCLSPDRRSVEAVVAEVHNTPWNETHAYVLTEHLEPAAARDRRGAAKAYEHPKVFHVSPFKGMQSRYRWRFTVPGEQLAVHVETAPTVGAAPPGPKDFDATLSLERREITGPSLAGALLRFPWMSAQVVAGIYFEAARLWLKGAPFHAHPTSVGRPKSGETSHPSQPASPRTPRESLEPPGARS